MPGRLPINGVLRQVPSGVHNSQNGKRKLVRDNPDAELNSFQCPKLQPATSGLDHMNGVDKPEPFLKRSKNRHPEHSDSSKLVETSKLLPPTLSVVVDDGFLVKNELRRQNQSDTKLWGVEDNREEVIPSGAATQVKKEFHDITKSANETTAIKTNEVKALDKVVVLDKIETFRSRTEAVVQAPHHWVQGQGHLDEHSSQSAVVSGDDWILSPCNLRHSATSAMQSYNLKNQSQPLPGSKEVGNAATSSRTVFKCPACQKEFVTEKYLCMHMALHRSQTAAASTSSVTVCTTSASSSLVSSTKHTGSKVAIPQTPDESVKLIKSDGSGSSHWTCKICSKTFAQSSNYKNHIRTHSDERPFVCNVCSIGFKERYHLKKHILFKHSDELKEECRVCGKRFKDSTAVRAHERIHSEERPYGCQRCEKTFKTSECLWHHENRSRTCGKSIKSSGTDTDGLTMNQVPRFRRGRQPGKRTTALSKIKSLSGGTDENNINEVSSCLGLDRLDHVEELPASVKIELEREIMPECYFKSMPGICAYEFENILDVFNTPPGARDDKEPTFSGDQLSGSSREVVGNINQVELKSQKSFDQTAALFWRNEWISNGAGGFLGSPSRPVSASYDSFGDAYSPGTPEKSWQQQDLSKCRHSCGLYVGEMVNSDLIESSKFNLVPYTQQQQQQQHQDCSPQVTTCVTTAAGGLPYAERGQVIEMKTESHPPASMQSHMQHIRRSFAQDFGSTTTTDEASNSSILILTSMTDTDLWPNKPVDAVIQATDKGSGNSATAAASSTISNSNVPTAVVAPFKRENSARPTSVNGGSSSDLDQPIKNLLPPFETFAPITLRGQKSQQVIHTAIPCSSPVVASYATFATPHTTDGSIADQCPTIQKYLLRGHPNASIKPNRGCPSDEHDRRSIALNRQWCTLTPRDNWKCPGIPPNQIPFTMNHGTGGRRQLPEFYGFVAESQVKFSGAESELLSLPQVTDANCAVNFIKMSTTPSSYSQSAIFQPRDQINEANTMSAVNLYHQI